MRFCFSTNFKKKKLIFFKKKSINYFRIVNTITLFDLSKIKNSNSIFCTIYLKTNFSFLTNILKIILLKNLFVLINSTLFLSYFSFANSKKIFVYTSIIVISTLLLLKIAIYYFYLKYFLYVYIESSILILSILLSRLINFV